MIAFFRRTFVSTTAAALALACAAGVQAQSKKAEVTGPVGPSPYDVVRSWQKPFSDPGYAFGGNSGVFAESPDRIFIAQRGETKLPDPLPPEYTYFAGSIGINVLTAPGVQRRVMKKNFLYTLDADGHVKERWNQWDSLFAVADRRLYEAKRGGRDRVEAG